MCQVTTPARGGRSPARKPTAAERRRNKLQWLNGLVDEIFSAALTALRNDDDMLTVEHCLEQIREMADPGHWQRVAAEEGRDPNGSLS